MSTAGPPQGAKAPPGGRTLHAVIGRGGHVVLDTNIVLDLWVFDDPRSQPLLAQLEAGAVRWLATASMREELRRVLDYPHIAQRLQARRMAAADVQLQADAPKAPYVCKDPDDQKFIDLAVQHTAALHSKDAQVLRMKNRLARCRVPLNPPIDTTKDTP
jgi:predicted nucleic acid-binding protein